MVRELLNPRDMPRKSIPHNTSGPYHISCRHIHRDYFNISMPEAWSVYSRQLFLIRHAFKLKIHSFVLMSNQYDMIASCPELNLSQAMAYFQRETSRDLNRRSQRINQNFVSRYHPCLLVTNTYFMNAYKYVYQNPLRAGLCNYVEDYHYSTINGLLGHSRLLIPIENDPILFDGKIENNLKWLNQIPNQNDTESIRRALRKPVFKLSRDPKTKRINRLENERL